MQKVISVVTLCLFYVHALFVVADDENIYVKTKQGLLKGKPMTSRNGNKFYGFFEIPYAKPPLGELRFKGPEEPEPWTGVRQATEDHGIICSQRNIYVKNQFFTAGKEDCLYMNIYTPQVHPPENKLYPVMVFLHGGGYTCGSANNKYYAPEYLMDKDIVFVGFNYRLGPLGFLSMEDEDLPGNNGLKDQNQALKWIQRNIENFGGNPDSVTIFGESAGGASVHYHMMSPMSKGLFHRGISQSGTGLCSWALSLPGVNRNNTIKVAEALRCPTHSTNALVKCLRTKPAEDIIGTDLLFLEWFKEPMIPFKPNVDKHAKKEDQFLPEHPEEAIKKGLIADVPWITGVNSGEGAILVASIYENDNLVQELNKKFNDIVPTSLFYRGAVSNVDETTQLIRKFYFGEEQVSNDTVGKVTDLWSDGWFIIGANDAVRLMYNRRKSPLYYYYMSYRGSVSFSSAFGDDSRDYGVCHADELIYLFPFKQLFSNVTYSESDKKYMTVMLDLWTNFAKFGEPTSDLLEENWKPVTTDKLEYLHLSKEVIKMNKELLPERIQFWSSLRSQQKLWVKDEL